MSRLITDAEQDELDVAQRKLDRTSRLHQHVHVIVWSMVATFALAAAGFLGWYLRGPR